MESSKIPYNFTYPSYFTFMHDVLGSFYQHWKRLDARDKSPIGWISIYKEYVNVEKVDVAYVLLLAVCWTVLRLALTAFVLQVSNIL